jgi:hypothetical protein
MFKKKNILSKLWLKYTDRPGYKNYKWDLINYKQHQYESFLTSTKKLTDFNKIKVVANTTHKLDIIHSGNAGDIIYALPTIKKIHELTGTTINLYLRLGKQSYLPNYNSHPVGNVMLNKTMADMLLPLIRSQRYINSCEIYINQNVDINLDYFRAGMFPMHGNIARWCSYITGVSPDLWKNWLEIEPDLSFVDKIIIARSGRYQNSAINYSFLNTYKNVVFIGVESEYKDIRNYIPEIRWVEVNDFLRMAEMIAGCKFFIGNQSFPYAIAEGLKIRRILEASFEVINVVPEGDNGFDFFFQDHFEWLVNNFNC